LNILFCSKDKIEFYAVKPIINLHLPGMKLHPIVEKLAPIIAGILLLLSHSKNVVKQVQTIDLPDIVSAWK
jgi:hypothetical protein